jgi:APA family basic amino acid/polyamine antiporter
MVEMIYWFELSGSGSLWALLVTGIMVVPLGLVYSEMSSMLPFAGGENVWISNAFSWNIGWFFNWTLYLLYILAMPTVAFGIVTMAGYFYPELSFQTTKLIALVILLVWFVFSNFRVRILASIQSVMFWIMIAASIFVSFNFILSAEWSFSNLQPWFPNGFSGFGAAVGILVFKFIGFDMIPQLSEEANFPRKHQWKAYLGSIAITLLIYALAILGNGGIVTTEWILNTDIVDPRVADLIGKHYLAVIIVVIGILGTVTTLSGFWLSAARNLFGAAKQNQLPHVFKKLNKSGQPFIGNIFVGIFAIYFTVFAPDAWIEYIYTVYAFAAGLVYMMVSLSFLILRKKHPEWERPFKLKFGVLFGILSLIFTLWILIATFSEIALSSLFILGGYFVIGIALLIYAKMKQKSDPEGWKQIVLTPDDIEK